MDEEKEEKSSPPPPAERGKVATEAFDLCCFVAGSGEGLLLETH